MIDPDHTVTAGFKRIPDYFARYDKFRDNLQAWEIETGGFSRDDFSFCPWEALGVHLDTYNSEIDEQAISVMEGIRDGKFNTDIAKETGLHPAHVELFQTMFSAVDLCEYGTSPRGCWPTDRKQFDRFLALWKAKVAE